MPPQQRSQTIRRRWKFYDRYPIYYQQRKRQHPLGSDRRRPASLFETAYQKDKGGNGHRSQKLQDGNLSYKRRGEAAVRSMRHHSMALEQERLSEAGQDRE